MDNQYQAPARLRSYSTVSILHDTLDKAHEDAMQRLAEGDDLTAVLISTHRLYKQAWRVALGRGE